MQRPKSTHRSRTPTTDKFMKFCRGYVGGESNHGYSRIRTQEIMLNQWRLMGYHWIACCDGQMPSRPVQCGCSRSGDPLYIARATTPGMTICLGVFHQPSGMCHLIWEGRQFCSRRYEILCQGPEMQKVPSTKCNEIHGTPRTRASTPRSRSTTPRSRATSLICSEFDDLGDTLKVQSLRSPLRLTNMFRK